MQTTRVMQHGSWRRPDGLRQTLDLLSEQRAVRPNQALILPTNGSFCGGFHIFGQHPAHFAWERFLASKHLPSGLEWTVGD